MIKNAFPPKLANSILYSTKQRTVDSWKNKNQTTEQNCFRSMVYIKGLSETLGRTVQSNNMKVAFSNRHNLGKMVFSNMKQQMDPMNKRNVIYKIPCADCDSVYVGQTSQQIKKRIGQHRNDIRKSTAQCALAKHAIENSHGFNFNNTKIIDRECNYKKRLMKEMLYIKSEGHACNYRTDVDKLSTMYVNLINRHR